MKFKLLVLGLVLAISACATSLLGKETQALQVVTSTLAVANAQFSAGKMSKETHAKTMLWADATKNGIDAAVKAGNAGTLAELKDEADKKLLEVSK